MNDQINQQSSHANDSPSDQPQKSPIDPAKIVNPSEDLVYKGGYTNDPEEILSNPGAVPEMLDDRRDIRPDLTRDSEDDLI